MRDFSAVGGALANIPEQPLSDADPMGIVCYKSANRCYVYSDYYECEAIIQGAPNALSPGDWVRFKVYVMRCSCSFPCDRLQLNLVYV